MSQTTTTTTLSPKVRASNNEPPSQSKGTQSALVTKVGHEGGPRKLHLIPTCSTPAELLHREKRHMAAAFRIFAKLGFGDGASGHISLRGEPLSQKSSL